MKEYTLKADNRRPLKFSGELLGQSDTESEATIKADIVSFLERYSGAPESAHTHIRLYLYRTKGGNVVLYTQRSYVLNVDSTWKLQAGNGQIDVHESLEAYIESAKKKDNSYGAITVKLLNDVLSNHPELEEFWVETID